MNEEIINYRVKALRIDLKKWIKQNADQEEVKAVLENHIRSAHEDHEIYKDTQIR